MKKKVKYILVFLLVIIYAFVIVYHYSNNENYIIFGKDTTIYYKDNKIKNIKYNKNKNISSSYEKFQTYVDGKFIDTYIEFKKGSDGWYQVYDTEYNKIYPYPLIAYNGDMNLNLYDKTLTEQSDSDKKIILSYLKDNNLSEEYNTFKKISYDIDNDGSVENIYYINYYGTNVNSYCAIFLQKNSTIVPIILNEFSSDEMLNVEQVDLINLIDIDFDNKYEIVISENKGDDSPIYYYFYKYDDLNNTVTKLK